MVRAKHLVEADFFCKVVIVFNATLLALCAIRLEALAVLNVHAA